MNRVERLVGARKARHAIIPVAPGVRKRLVLEALASRERTTFNELYHEVKRTSSIKRSGIWALLRELRRRSLVTKERPRTPAGRFLAAFYCITDTGRAKLTFLRIRDGAVGPEHQYGEK